LTHTPDAQFLQGVIPSFGFTLAQNRDAAKTARAAAALAAPEMTPRQGSRSGPQALNS